MGMFVLLLMWFGISVPLVFVGAFFGFKAPVKENPVRTNEIPRQIPLQAWYMGGAFNVLMGGILPFGVIFIELFFIMTSVWLQRFYYVFGFLALVMLILIVTCAEISVVLCYFQLCNEDYHWWWRSFLNSGAAGLYLLGYSFVYFYTQLDMVGFVPCLVYFGAHRLAPLRPHDRHRRLPLLVVVRAQDLLRRQGGLGRAAPGGTRRVYVGGRGRAACRSVSVSTSR